jgi:hypothetical protein
MRFVPRLARRTFLPPFSVLSPFAAALPFPAAGGGVVEAAIGEGGAALPVGAPAAALLAAGAETAKHDPNGPAPAEFCTCKAGI